MTIAAAFKCSDGWILAADSQETVSDYSKKPTDKIDLFNVNPDWRIVFAGAGDSGYPDMLKWQIEKSCRATAVLDLEKAERIIAAEVMAIHKKHIWPRSNKPVIEALILAQRTKPWSGWDGVRMFATSDSAVFPVDEYHAIGVGSHLANYLSARCFNYSPAIHSAGEVELSAVYILQQVKDSIHGCDGQSLIGLFGLDGRFRFVRTRTLEKIETAFRGLDSVFNAIFVGCAAQDMSEVDFAEKLQSCQEELARIHKEQLTDLPEDMKP